jgi:energy-converting hydrogenase Eha subunit A
LNAEAPADLDLTNVSDDHTRDSGSSDGDDDDESILEECNFKPEDFSSEEEGNKLEAEGEELEAEGEELDEDAFLGTILEMTGKSEENIAALAIYSHCTLSAACIHVLLEDSIQNGDTFAAEWLVENHCGTRMPLELSMDEIRALLRYHDRVARKWIPLCSLHSLASVLIEVASTNIQSVLVDYLLALPQLADELAHSSSFWRVNVFGHPSLTLPALDRIVRSIFGRGDCQQVTKEALLEPGLLSECDAWDMMCIVGRQLLHEPSEERESVATAALILLRRLEGTFPVPTHGRAPARQLMQLVLAFRWSDVFVRDLQRICSRRDLHPFNSVVLARAIKRFRAAGVHDLVPEPSPSAMELAMGNLDASVMLYEDGNAVSCEDDVFVAEPVLYHVVHQYDPMPIVITLVEGLGADIHEVSHAVTPLLARIKWLASRGRQAHQYDDPCILYLLAHGATTDCVPDQYRYWLPAPVIH